MTPFPGFQVTAGKFGDLAGSILRIASAQSQQSALIALERPLRCCIHWTPLDLVVMSKCDKVVLYPVPPFYGCLSRLTKVLPFSFPVPTARQIDLYEHSLKLLKAIDTGGEPSTPFSNERF